MKAFSSRSIQNLEILQLLVLDAIFSLPISMKLLFQGGTCLRWVYNGTRYSEDLGFLGESIKRLDINELQRKLEKILEKRFIVQFGPGVMEASTSHKSSGRLHVIWIKYLREGERRKMAVKIEIQEAEWNEAERSVLRHLPEVGRFLLEAMVRVPFGRSIIQCAPVQEILAEKIKALLERPYIKGRDLYDIWFISQSLQISIEPELVIERTQAYPGRFIPKRSLKYLQTARGQKRLFAALTDLSRFVPPEEITIMRKGGFKTILRSVDTIIAELLAKGLNEKIIS